MGYFIIGCEIAFWVFVLAGLTSRYIFKLKKLGALLLLCTPLIDLALIVATIFDLKAGATATVVHSLSAIYIGVSIAFGHKMIRWADERFAYRFAGGPLPAAKPKYGPEHAKHERTGCLLHLLAYAICYGVITGINYIVGDAARTGYLSSTVQIWGVIVAIDVIISLSYTFWPKQAKGSANKQI